MNMVCDESGYGSCAIWVSPINRSMRKWIAGKDPAQDFLEGLQTPHVAAAWSHGHSSQDSLVITCYCHATIVQQLRDGYTALVNLAATYSTGNTVVIRDLHGLAEGPMGLFDRFELIADATISALGIHTSRDVISEYLT